MPADYIPSADAAFDAWLTAFHSFALANLAALGLVAGDLTPVSTARGDWLAKYAANNAGQQAAQAARQAKDASRAAAEAVVRTLVRRLQVSKFIDNAKRAALGITVPDATPTPTAAPAAAPRVRIEAGQRLRHVIHFSDSNQPTRKARPPGTLGAEIWVQVAALDAPPPSDPAALTFVALDTRTPYLLEFDAGDGGKNAHYLLRWVSTRGEKGPWSETATATIGA